MWDTIQEQLEQAHVHLSRDLPCPDCGHGAHSYLPCSDTCACARGRALTVA